MNAPLLSASQPTSPLLFSATEDNRKSGIEMKHRWIEQVLRDMQKTNETMGQRRRSDTHRVARASKKSSPA
jgi:hypothetical protein